jgi:hypothetical protein
MRRKPQVGLIDMYCGMGMKVGGGWSSCIRTAHSRSAAPWAVALPLAGIVLGFGFAAVSGCALLAACAGVCTPLWPPVLWPPVHHKVLFKPVWSGPRGFQALCRALGATVGATGQASHATAVTLCHAAFGSLSGHVVLFQCVAMSCTGVSVCGRGVDGW